MNKRDILVGLVVVLLLVILFNRISNQDNGLQIVEESPAANIEQNLEQVLGREISDTGEKLEFSGDYGTAVVVRDGSKLSVLADLDEPSSGLVYQVWISGDNLPAVSLGTLQPVKGGYLLEKSTSYDLDQYNTVTVSLEKTIDPDMEAVVFEGSFE